MKTERLTVGYVGDETDVRSKKYGAKIIDQLAMSITSIRSNWSSSVQIIFIHTKPLSSRTISILDGLKVMSKRARRVLEPTFPIANKILLGETYRGNNDILFLDCDTIVHQPLNFDLSKDMLIAFDALQDVTSQYYTKLYKSLNIAFPTGRFSEKPSYEYYYNNNTSLFPLVNSGVFFIKNHLLKKFYASYEDNFHKTYALFKNDMDFYFDQICFALTMKQLEIPFNYFPKGYNFICTPRAPYLKNWPKSQIYIEHYAGDSSKPLVFYNNRIDIEKSGLS